MCFCCGEVLNGRIPGPFTSGLAERWAREALIAPKLAQLHRETDAEIARRLNVPDDQVQAARRTRAGFRR
jgi:hypothetical protein